MKNKTAIAQNNKVIKDFFSIYGKETSNTLSKFLFLLQGEILKNRGWTEDYAGECVMHFQMLHTLVTDLEPLE